MKKVLLGLAVLASLAAVHAQATQFWNDTMQSYPDGCITTNTTVWFAHPPGSLTANDMLIVTSNYTSGAALDGKRLRVNGLNNEYAMRLFDPVNTNSVYGGSVYASFIVNASFVPSAGKGTYFANFNGVYPSSPPDGTSATNGFQFSGRVFEIGNTNAWPYTTTAPLTYRFGVANALGDPASATPGPQLYVPIDLIKGVDYQVVLKYDIDNAVAYLGVNPAADSITANSNWSGPTSDTGAITNGLAGLLFRQRTGGGTVDIRDVVVGDTFADVMTYSAATSPVLVATNYQTVTNYAGNPALLEVFATSFGGGTLNYKWYQISGGTTNPVGGNSQTYLKSSLAGSDTGNYFCAVTNSGGQGALSGTNFFISVNAAPTPPGFTTKPAVTVTSGTGSTLTLSCVAFGTGPLSYQWAFNSNPLTDGAPVTGNPGDVSLVAGSQTPALTVSGLTTNETGNFTVTVTSGGGVSPNTTNATTAVTVLLPTAVTIAYLRSLENANWQAGDTTSLFIVSNAVVTTYANTTSGTTSSYYIQDATGGINLFVTGDNTFRPKMGDIVAACGSLASFNNGLELAINAANSYQYYVVTGNTNLLPAPVVFSLDLTNNAGLMETNLEGRICMLTNVAFTVAQPASLTANYNTYVTNNSPNSVPFNVFWPAGQDPDMQNRTLTTNFAYTITGVLSQFKSGTTYGAGGYELIVTRIGDIQTNPPPAVTDLTAKLSGQNVVLNWTAVPYTIDTRGAYSYTVLAATNVKGPYLPLASLAFNTTNGTYTVTNALQGTRQFYRISSP